MDSRLNGRTLYAALALLSLASAGLGARELTADRRLQLALAAVEEHRWGDAALELERLREAASSDRQEDEATFWLAYAKYQAGEMDEAGLLARELVQGHAGHVWAGPAALLLDAIGRRAGVTAPDAGTGMTRGVRTHRAGTPPSGPSASSGTSSGDDRLGGGVSLYIPIDRGKGSGALYDRNEPGLIIDMLGAPSPELRAAALEMLLLLGQTPDTPTVIGIYLDADREARRRIIEALASVRAADALREIVGREDDERLHQAAAARLQALR